MLDELDADDLFSARIDPLRERDRHEFLNCVQDAIDEGSADRSADGRRRSGGRSSPTGRATEGHPRHTAEVMAAMGT